jgi:hypothetical protein
MPACESCAEASRADKRKRTGGKIIIPVKHGTNGGYVRHTDKRSKHIKEWPMKPCDLFRDAHNAYNREKYVSRAA